MTERVPIRRPLRTTALLALVMLLLAAPFALARQDDAPPPGGADAMGQEAADAAAEAAQELAEQAAADPSAVPVSQLERRVSVLRREQLEAEAERWLGLLQATSLELVEIEIDAQGAEGEAKSALLAEAATIRDRRTALIDRVRVVLDELELKGGDVAQHRKYVNQQAGLDIDPSDWQGALLTIWNWMKAPEGGVRVGLRIVWFIVIVVAFWILSRILGRVTRAALGRMKNSSTLLREFLGGIVQKLTLVLGIIVGIAQLGVSVAPLVAAIGGAVIVVGLALQGTLSNFASGIMILMFRPFDVGDVVDAGGVTGKVESLSLFSTTVLTFDNQVKIVPNTSIWSNVITNITGRDTRRVDMVFGIGYGDDMAHAARILEEVVTGHEKVLPDPAPMIKVGALGESSVDFLVRPWSRTADYWDVYWDVTRLVKERFDAEGISIPFPQRDVHVHQAGPAGADD